MSHKSCPISIDLVKSITAQDQTMSRLKDVIYRGWPTHAQQCPQELQDYWNFRCSLVLEDGLILKGDRIVIPKSLRDKVLATIHSGHRGETKCFLLSRQSVFWPGITNDKKSIVKGCQACNKYQSAQLKLPTMQPDLLTRLSEKLGSDIFEFNGSRYLIIVDYCSRFPVVRLLRDMTATTNVAFHNFYLFR